jgi:ATP-dependent RNA helicase DeaD
MKKFEELNLSAPLMKAIQELGYETPSPIQAEALPLLLGNDTDFLGLAATGTGKTAAFSIPLLERIDESSRGVQALVLCPTRELAIQVAGQIDLLGKYKGVRALPIYGGAGYGDQIRGLKNGATIVVGTPGRVVDHMEKGTLDLSGLKTLILDEADEMISMGFKDDLEFVLSRVPTGQANIWLFSATMGREVRHVADEYLKNPQKVQINRTEMLPATVEQVYYMIHEYDKPDLLTKVIDAADDFYGIVFCQTKSLVVDVTTFLSGRGYKVDCLHGDLNQEGRDRVMRAFREKRISVLVATDVACRGLDVKDVTHVVNYSIPRELDNYVHRIGRTGRSGKSGKAISFVTRSHMGLVGRIEQMTKSRMTEGRPPSLKDIALKKTERAQKLFVENGPQGRMTELLGEPWINTINELSKEEIVGRFITMLYPELAGGSNKAPSMADSRAPSADKPERAPKRYADGPKAYGEKKFRDKPRSEDLGDTLSRPTFPKAKAAEAAAAPFVEASEDSSTAKYFDDETKPARPAKRFKEDGDRPAKKFDKKFGSGPKFADRSERRFDSRGPKKEFNDKRTPPWERKPAFEKSFDKPFKKSFKKSTPWGGKSEGPVRPKGKWEGKKPFSAREASEGGSASSGKVFRKWESRPSKTNR